MTEFHELFGANGKRGLTKLDGGGKMKCGIKLSGWLGNSVRGCTMRVCTPLNSGEQAEGVRIWTMSW